MDLGYKRKCMSNKQWTVLSPDGFAIHPEDTYTSKKAAKAAFKEWAKRFERQGYYSSAGGRIELIALEDYCQFIELEDDESILEIEIKNFQYEK